MNKRIKTISIILFTFILILLFNGNVFAATKTYYQKDRNYNIYILTIDLDTEEGTLKCETYRTGEIITYRHGQSETDANFYGWETTVEIANKYNIVQRQFAHRVTIDTLDEQWSTTKPTVPTPPSSETLRERDKNVDLEKVINSGDNFLNIGNKEQIPEEAIQNLSDTIYSTTLTIGIIIAILVGAFLGVKFIISGMEGKAEVKQILLPYGIGVVVLFGAFTIWKIVLTILQN